MLRGEPSGVDQLEGTLNCEMRPPDQDIEEPLEEEEPLVPEEPKLAPKPLKEEFVPKPSLSNPVDLLTQNPDFPNEEEEMEDEEDPVPMNSSPRGVWE